MAIDFSRETNICKCGACLLDETEKDTGICGHCADIAYEKYLARQEWVDFHPSDTATKKD